MAKKAIYREENKEATKEIHKRYYDAHKDEISKKANVKHDCKCGGKYIHQNKAQHERSKKHQAYLNPPPPIQAPQGPLKTHEERRAVLYDCECGARISIGSKERSIEIRFTTRVCRSRWVRWLLPLSQRHRSSPPSKRAGSASVGRTRCGCPLCVNDLL